MPADFEERSHRPREKRILERSQAHEQLQARPHSAAAWGVPGKQPLLHPPGADGRRGPPLLPAQQQAHPDAELQSGDGRPDRNLHRCCQGLQVFGRHAFRPQGPRGAQLPGVEHGPGAEDREDRGLRAGQGRVQE
ncbi:hypothetical protein CEXT_490301 [Caerostris extrusa]|uniref:Uncharacterized protein n=1 Tax=Caerostris extrusa TaxID=172846 RepID=A0AAV4PRY0_CAEEX|nr:hypothetical protein CEXT_490301 [Caerostris extrusa]